MTFDLTTLPPLIAAMATAVGLARLLELWVTRHTRRTGDVKIEAEAASVISVEARAWAAQADGRARAAEEQADRIQAKLQEIAVQLSKLEGRIARCQAGPVCPVRTAQTDPAIPKITD